MRAKSQCRAWLRRSRFVLAAALATFVAGAAVATDGNYCEEFDTSDCIVLDETVTDSCCVNLDGTGLRSWTCTREQFYCTDGYEFNCVLGPGFNWQQPGPSCQ